MGVMASLPLAAVAALCCAAVACGDSPSGPPAAATDLQLVQVASGLVAPVHLTAPPGDARLFVVEQHGRVRIIDDGQLLEPPFLDIRASVRSGGEQGLLSIAFHPAYAANGRFFVNFTDLDGHTRIVRYTVSADRNRADAASAALILHVEQPFANHNGGQLAFGPDGMLYVGMGDGGGGGDPLGHGQNPATLHGALLRVDVDGGEPYRVPPDNPYADATHARGEIWAIGLRNPWRFSFDADQGLIYIADVGQGRREEVNVQAASSAGLNYGWNRMEASLCYPPGSACEPTGLVLPVYEYGNPADGCSVTGGHVYRGSDIPDLRGHYFLADFCRGWVRSFRHVPGAAATDVREWPLGEPGRITSFGVDAAGELYIVVHEGRVYRLDRT
jgi:glucose/arabinose dehydrogenase